MDISQPWIYQVALRVGNFFYIKAGLCNPIEGMGSKREHHSQRQPLFSLLKVSHEQVTQL